MNVRSVTRSIPPIIEYHTFYSQHICFNINSVNLCVILYNNIMTKNLVFIWAILNVFYIQKYNLLIFFHIKFFFYDGMHVSDVFNILHRYMWNETTQTVPSIKFYPLLFIYSSLEPFIFSALGSTRMTKTCPENLYINFVFVFFSHENRWTVIYKMCRPHF